MYVPAIDYHEANSLEEASALLQDYAPDARLLAGGTDLLVDLKTGRFGIGHLISINSIADLRGVEQTPGGLRIGALTTITELDRAQALTGKFAAIRDATSRMAAPQVRNAATVGGNIAGAVPCADLPPVLMVMNATVNLWSPAGGRTLALDAFLVGPRETARRDEEVMTAVVVPLPPSGFGAAYERFSLRNGNAIAVAGVAAGLVLADDNTVSKASITLAAVAPITKYAEEVANIIIGRPLDEDVLNAAGRAAKEAAEPISDIRGTAGYRRDVVEVLTRRALMKAARRARETDQ